MAYNKPMIACVIALAAVIPSVSFFTYSEPSQNSAMVSSGHMLGHVVLVHKDQSGNIVQYRQTDNFIVNHGDDCALGGLIEGTAGGGSCGTTAAGFINIGLGNGTTTALKTDSKLATEQTAAGLARAAATPAFTSSAANSNNGAKVVLTHTFTSNSAMSQTVSETGLFNSTTANALPMVAHDAFATITLATSDTLAVTWTITIN